MLLPFWSPKNLVQCLLAYTYFFIAQLILTEEIYLSNKFIEHVQGIVLGSGDTRSLQKKTQFKKWNLHSVNKILEGMFLSFSSVALLFFFPLLSLC